MLSEKTVKDYAGRINLRRYLMKIELLFTSFKDDEKDFLGTLNEYANWVKVKIASTNLGYL